jgi:plasmid stabilization system protein ParE
VPTKLVEFHDEASVEYDAAFDWYLARSTEAALDFDAEVYRALSDIASAPQRWAVGQHSTRRYLLRKFPYILVYRERVDDIQIIAVAHTSRRPGYWKKRLPK